MPATRESVLKSAMELSESDRVLLANELMASVSDDLPGLSVDDPGFLEELDRRAADGSAGVPWSTVQAVLEADAQP